MLLAVNEITRNRIKFGMITIVLGLIVFLLILLSAMSNGLLLSLTGAVKNSNADLFVLKKGSHFNIQGSNLPGNTVDKLAAVKGVEYAAPLGYTVVNVDSGSKNFDIALFGIKKRSFAEPVITKGDKLGDDVNDIVVDNSLLGNGLKIGDNLNVKSLNRRLTIVGTTKGNKLSMLPVAYIDYSAWNEINLALKFNNNKQLIKLDNNNDVNVVLIKAKSGTDLVALQKKLESVDSDIEVATKDEVISAFPGMGPMQMVVKALQVFSFAIGIAVIGIFFYIITIQKTPQIGALKAMGASDFYILNELFIQATLLTLFGAVIGILLAVFSIRMIPPAISMHLNVNGLVFSAAGVYLMSLAGTLFSARHIFKIDPGIALGQAQ